MKIILTESQLNSLINESLGVNESAIDYTNFIYNLLEPVAIQMVESGKKKIKEIDINVDKLIKFIKKDPVTFEELPIEELELDLAFIPTKKSLVGDKPFAVGGGFYDIQNENNGGSYIIDTSFLLPKNILDSVSNSIHAKLQFEIYVNESFDQSMIDELLYDLRDTITHELNHLYESYKRWGSSGKGTTNVVKSYAGTKNVNTPGVIFEVYSKFLYFLYYSEPWEINANVQEAFSKVSRMSFEEFKKTEQWRIANEMEKYSAKNLFNEVVKIAETKDPETVDFHIKNLHKFYLKQHLKYDKASKEADEIKDTVYKTKNLLGLFKKYEQRINSAGRKLKKNYMRLYSIEK
jgi:hypothetical protein